MTEIITNTPSGISEPFVSLLNGISTMFPDKNRNEITITDMKMFELVMGFEKLLNRWVYYRKSEKIIREWMEGVIRVGDVKNTGP